MLQPRESRRFLSLSCHSRYQGPARHPGRVPPAGPGVAPSGDEVRGHRNLVDDEWESWLLRRPAASALDGDDDTIDDQFASPDAVHLGPLEGAVQALLGQSALLADRLRAGDVELVLGEEQMRQRAVAVGATRVPGTCRCD